MRVPCIQCKGKNPKQSCGRDFCPIIAKSEAMFKIRQELPKTGLISSSPAPFIGRFGYPNVNVGILAPVVNIESWKYDAPRFWAANGISANEVIGYRSSLINSRFKSHIRHSNGLMEISKEIGMASKPVDVELTFKDKPCFRIRNDDVLPPMGPNAPIEKAKITSNPFVSSKVERVVSDTSLKASDALAYLYNKGFDENFLTKMLSVGAVGVGISRKLVPTRWAIAATDDIIAKNLLANLRNLTKIDVCTSYFGGYLGNYYLVLLFSDSWSYELFEAYLPDAVWNQGSEIQFSSDYEPYEGRKDYASNTSGGYYAARLPLAEKLAELKKQASALVLRFITGEYTTPLGVWVCREAMRKALAAKPIEFANRSYMLSYARILGRKKFGYDIHKILKQSRLVYNLTKQNKLTKYL